MCWYRPDEIATRLACLTLLVQFASIFSSLLGYGVDFANGYANLSGWQFMFLITAALGLIHAAVIFFFLPDWPDSPQSRRSLYSVEEGEFMVARLPPGTPRSTHKAFDWPAIRKELKSPLLCRLTCFHQSRSRGLHHRRLWLHVAFPQ
jgi:MFS family permease